MKKLPKTILKWADANPEKFDEGWTEQDGFARDGGWSHWIYFKPGWINPLQGTHLVHEPTVKECMEALRATKPCACDDCKSGGQAAWR